MYKIINQFKDDDYYYDEPVKRIYAIVYHWGLEDEEWISIHNTITEAERAVEAIPNRLIKNEEYTILEINPDTNESERAWGCCYGCEYYWPENYGEAYSPIFELPLEEIQAFIDKLPNEKRYQQLKGK